MFESRVFDFLEYFSFSYLIMLLKVSSPVIKESLVTYKIDSKCISFQQDFYCVHLSFRYIGKNTYWSSDQEACRNTTLIIWPPLYMVPLCSAWVTCCCQHRGVTNAIGTIMKPTYACKAAIHTRVWHSELGGWLRYLLPSEKEKSSLHAPNKEDRNASTNTIVLPLKDRPGKRQTGNHENSVL